MGGLNSLRCAPAGPFQPLPAGGAGGWRLGRYAGRRMLWLGSASHMILHENWASDHMPPRSSLCVFLLEF